MGLIKEYLDRAVQTESDTASSPYADPAVVLAAPPLTRHGPAQEAHTRAHGSVLELSPLASDSTFGVTQSPISPLFAPLISRRLSRRKLARYPTHEILNRRIVSMPENKIDASSCHGKRVVSMPDRVRPVLEPSAELSRSPSTAAGDSFESHSGHRERVRVFSASSDMPQTPSPPSSPESLLIIASGAQLPEGFLRRKYSPEPLVEEDEELDWITWANSPPRPIPALHGPLSLPYARCPSGAEGTIIEEPDNMAQMIWGLGPDDQSHSQIREGSTSHINNPQNVTLHGPCQVPTRTQKKKMHAQQAHKSSRSQISAHMNYAKQSASRTQRLAHDDKRDSLGQAPSNIEIHQDTTGGLLWNEGQPMPASFGVPDNHMSDPDVFSADGGRVLEWQLSRLRHALQTSLANVDPHTTYPRRLNPAISASAASGLPQSYPRIFVEPRPNESVSRATGQSPIELVQQYHQQQLCRQALRKQKVQMEDILPTPPNSSSPQWSSHFSPYLTYCSTFSPELVGSSEHPVTILSHKYRSSVDPSQYLRHVYDQHEHGGSNDFDTSTNVLSVQVPQVASSAASCRQSPSSSSTLAKYIKQLQALSPIARFSPLQPTISANVVLPSSINENTTGPLQNVYHSPAVPSLESPKTLSRESSYHHARSMASRHPMQRRLSSVPEEDSASLEFSAHDEIAGHQRRYLEVPPADVMQKTGVLESLGFEDNLGAPPIVFHETSPAKVRLPVNRGHDTLEHANGHHEENKGHQHGHRKKHRYKKPKGPAAANEQSRRLVG